MESGLHYAVQRTVKPEILDSLPEGHPDALKNRRDLLMLNRLMRNFGWFNRNIRRHLRADDRILEIGSGVGELGHYLSRRALKGFSGDVAGLDFWGRPAMWPAKWLWVRGDLLAFADYPRHSIILANMVLHQFSTEQLREWAHIALPETRLLLVNEPTRRKSAVLQFRAACLLGLNYVSRHDGRISIEAGFRNHELPDMLGLDPQTWNVRVATSVLSGYRLIAERRNA